MKTFILAIAGLCLACIVHAQTYPEPEFSNEVCYLKKEAVFLTMRLEKSSSKMEAKTKMGGFGGMENGYTLDGEGSNVHLNSGSNLSFVFSTGASVKQASPEKDSMMEAGGMDPSMMNMSMSSMMDPASMISLYKAESGKGKRKIIMQKTGGAMAFGGAKMKSADKYTFSIKKVRDGYWELVVDKVLPKGEYAFSVMSLGMGSVDGETALYAFAID
jgi:hypothetical protein